jgi:hypothetical protein
VHEQRQPQRCDALQHGSERLEPVRRCDRAGRNRDAGAPPRRQRVDVSGIGRVERKRAPRRELRRQRLHPFEVRVDQLESLVPGQRLDPDRARDRDQREVEPVVADELRATSRSLRRQVDHVRLLGRAVEHAHAFALADQRKRRAGREPVDERLGPDVLMDVDSHHLRQILQ